MFVEKGFHKSPVGQRTVPMDLLPSTFLPGASFVVPLFLFLSQLYRR